MNFEGFIIKHAKKIIIATTMLVLLCIIPILHIRINPDLESYIPEDIEARVNINKISDIFGAEDNLLLLVESQDILDPASLEQISFLGAELEQITGITQVYSLYHAKSITGKDGSLVAQPVIPFDFQAGYNHDSLMHEIRQNDLVYKLLVSEDFKASLIILGTDKSVKDQEMIESIQKLIRTIKGNTKVTLTGMPYLREEANHKITADLLLLLPLGILVMFIFLWVSFRSLKGVLLPMSVVLISILVSLALIPVFGWELGLIGVLIPIMMIAIANNYGVHVFARYQEETGSDNGKSHQEIVYDVIRYLKKPVLLTGLTTMAGVLGLVTHILLPAAQMGVVASISIGLALLLSVTFIPSIMIFFKPDKRKTQNGSRLAFLQRILGRCADFVTRHYKLTIGLFMIIFLVTITGLKWFRIAPDSSDVLPASHPFNIAAKGIDQKFGGTKMIQIMFSGDGRDPVLARKMDRLSYQISQIEGVGSVNSLSTIIRKISMAMNEPGSPQYDVIPDNFETIAQYIELYNMSGDPEGLEQFADFNFEHTLLTVQYKAESMSELKSIVRHIKDLVKDDEDCVAVGGYSMVDKALGESVFRGQNYSLIFAFVVIALLLAWIFKSPFAGLLGSLPLVFAVFVTFGMMGWLGIELNIVTALLSSISIGLGVDFTIHMFWRLKSELSQGADMKRAVKTALVSIGRGISINALSVIAGFAILFFSAFPLIHSFSFLIVLSIFLCLLCALLFIPALCLVIKPRFLYR